MVEADDLPKGVMWESCAIMQYLCNKHGLDAVLPQGAGGARDDRQRDVLYHRHALSLCGARDLSGARLPPISRRSRRERRRAPEAKAAAQKAAADAIAEPLDVFHSFYMSGKPFIGGDHPSIADIRLAATLEFLAVIDYELPAWAKHYKDAIESTLGAAYGARRRRARLHRLREVAEEVGRKYDRGAIGKQKFRTDRSPGQPEAYSARVAAIWQAIPGDRHARKNRST